MAVKSDIITGDWYCSPYEIDWISYRNEYKKLIADIKKELKKMEEN